MGGLFRATCLDGVVRVWLQESQGDCAFNNSFFDSRIHSSSPWGSVSTGIVCTPRSVSGIMEDLSVEESKRVHVKLTLLFLQHTVCFTVLGYSITLESTLLLYSRTLFYTYYVIHRHAMWYLFSLQQRQQQSAKSIS